MTKSNKFTTIRNGKAVEYDIQVRNWRQKRRKKARKQRAAKEVLTLARNVLGNEATTWLKSYQIPQYKKTPFELLQNGKFTAVKKILNRLSEAQK